MGVDGFGECSGRLPAHCFQVWWSQRWFSQQGNWSLENFRLEVIFQQFLRVIPSAKNLLLRNENEVLGVRERGRRQLYCGPVLLVRISNVFGGAARVLSGYDYGVFIWTHFVCFHIFAVPWIYSHLPPPLIICIKGHIQIKSCKKSLKNRAICTYKLDQKKYLEKIQNLYDTNWVWKMPANKMLICISKLR